MKRLVFIFFLLEILLLGALVLGARVASADTTLFNPLAIRQITTPEELVTKVLIGFAGLMGAIAIAFTVFNGFKLVIASSEETIQTAKKGLTWSVGGFIVSLLTYTIVAGVAKLIGFDASQIGTDVLQSPLTGPTDKTSFISVMNYVMIQFLGLVGFATILMIVYYGYRYVTSAGNEEAIEKAKAGLKWSLLGFVITILAYTIINAIQTAFFP